MRKLLAEGKIATYEKGEIVVRLIEQEDVAEEEALIAASKCDDVESAIELLAQECQLCMNVMKMTEVKKVDFHFLSNSSRHAQTFDQNSKLVPFDYFHLTKFLQFTEFRLI